MQISYCQGLVSAQANFLQIGQTDSRYVDIIVSPTPVIATVASESTDYLIGEQRTVVNAWGPFTTTDTAYLYWDINPATGLVTRGHTNLSLIISATPPAPMLNQMWWNSSTNTMHVFNGTKWAPVLRVFAGTLNSGSILTQSPFTSQVGLNVATDAGYILTDALGQAFKNPRGKFLTTDTPISSLDTGSLVKLQGAQVIVQANESIPKFSLVYIAGGRASLASGDPALDGAKAPLAMVTYDAYQNDAITLVTSGQVVVNEQWAWATSLHGSSVYCDNFGQVTTVKPIALKNSKVGTIMNANSILLSFYAETEASSTSSGIDNVAVIAPVTRSGTVSLPVIGMTRSTEVVDGYLAATDFARIPAIETALASKAHIIHSHAIADVTNLESTLDSKANLVHQHEISDTNGLLAALNSKSSIGHTHTKIDITDLQPTLNVMDAATAAKIPKVSPSIAGNFPELLANGALADSGTNAASFSLAVHGHNISDIANLQVELNGKSLIGHEHVIANVTGLQAELNGKSLIGHVHNISDISGLQAELNGKSLMGHVHTLQADLTDVKIATPTEKQVLVFRSSDLSWINSEISISMVATLEDELLSRSIVGHTHTIGEVDGLQLALESKADLNHSHDLPAHTHDMADINALDIALNGKADVLHVHEMSDVIGLQVALGGKTDLGHGHVIGDVALLQDSLNGKADIAHTHAIGDLTDVAINSSPVVGDVLTFNGTAWTPAVPAGGPSTASGTKTILFTIAGRNLFDSSTVYWESVNAANIDNASSCTFDAYDSIFRFNNIGEKSYKITVHGNVRPTLYNADLGIWQDTPEWPVQSQLYSVTSSLQYSGGGVFTGPNQRRFIISNNNYYGLDASADWAHTFFVHAGSDGADSFMLNMRTAFADSSYGYSENTFSEYQIIVEIEEIGGAATFGVVPVVP